MGHVLFAASVFVLPLLVYPSRRNPIAQFIWGEIPDLSSLSVSQRKKLNQFQKGKYEWAKDKTTGIVLLVSCLAAPILLLADRYFRFHFSFWASALLCQLLYLVQLLNFSNTKKVTLQYLLELKQSTICPGCEYDIQQIENDKCPDCGFDLKPKLLSGAQPLELGMPCPKCGFDPEGRPVHFCAECGFYYPDAIDTW